MYTNEGLVNHCKWALHSKTKYMWGGIMRTITPEYIKLLSGIPAYKEQYPASRINNLNEFVGKGYYGCDCVGLIKSYYWSGNLNGGGGSKYYGKPGFPDVNAHGMYNAATVKGSIGTLPNIAGLILYSKTNPHVGVYIGNGMVIECTLSKRGDGVVMSHVNDFKWEQWFECPYISYAPITSIDEIANQVIRGEWGVGNARKERLTKAGYEYDKVQRRVNEILRGK